MSLVAAETVVWEMTDRTRWWLKRRILACHSSVTSSVSVNDSQAEAHDSWPAAGK